MPSSGSTSAFFYGTLMHPKILKRVIGNDGAHLQICPALLPNYTRHQIKYADYPGILPYHQSRALLARDLPEDERCVRGTLVVGLTPSDMQFLDVFEGNEYARHMVPVHPLEPFAPLSDPAPTSTADVPPPPAPSSLPSAVPAETYVYAGPLGDLRAEVWDYATFVRENAWKWVGAGAADNADYVEVERRRAMDGNIVRVAGGGEVVREEF